MKFDTPAGANPIDRQTVIGKPHDRIDGPLKVAGAAHYAYEYHAEAPNVAYGFVVGAGIAKGAITSIDTSEAEAAPGVLLVLTHRNVAKQGVKKGQSAAQLQGPAIDYFDQPVAFVVADSFEQARAAARLVRIGYRSDAGRFDLAAAKGEAGPVGADMGPPSTAVGDFDGAFANAPVKLDATYTTPPQSHAMMEPHASLALWQGDRLTVYTAHQMLNWATGSIAGTLMIPKDKLRVVSRFVGGGFGSKLMCYGDPILAALAARRLGRPVKVALTRPQIFNGTTHRSATIQRVRIGADKAGRITAIGHEDWSYGLDSPAAGMAQGNSESSSFQTRLMYAGADRMTSAKVASLDLPPSFAMRAPGEAVGLLALENAMDELAETLGIDPVDLRILNDTQHDPEKGPSRPFSDRKLVECLKLGAERFGWTKRNPKPGQARDGDWLIGLGVAGAIRNNLVMSSGARITLAAGPRVVVETAMTDIGTGSYTIIAQTAAEMLGLPIGAIEVRLGDSSFPESSGSGGSWGGNSSTAGVYAACVALRAQLAQKAGFNVAEVEFSDGRLRAGGRSVALKEIAASGPVTAEDKMDYGDLTETFAQASFAAHFCEVGVDRYTAEVRVRRMLTVASCGRILNPKTARSQCLGGMTMGIGAALMEEMVIDRRFGYFVNHDLAEYQVPVHADIPDLDVVFLDGVDDKSSPMKARGVGELGICGVGAAVTNAIHNATGVRVRDYPVTMDKLLPGLAAV